MLLILVIIGSYNYHAKPHTAIWRIDKAINICTFISTIWAKRKVKVPLNLRRACKDFDLIKNASKSKPTARIDIGGAAKFWELLLRRSLPLERVALILGTTVDTSIPSNTCKAASIFPFWYSYLPSNALASWNLYKPTWKMGKRSVKKYDQYYCGVTKK